MASARKKKNTIIKLCNAQGLWCADSGEIDTLIGSYFTYLFFLVVADEHNLYTYFTLNYIIASYFYLLFLIN